MILLAPDQIHTNLSQLNFKTPYTLHCFSSIDSTNQFLNVLPPNKQLTLCCTEEQTAGRGRFGRQWSSPFGENIYFSGRWHLATGLNKLSGLSLVIGLAIIESLKKSTINAEILIKWPNDLFWQDKKLGGILIELNSDKHNISDVTIGIGLNVNSDNRKTKLCDSPWCSLLDITGLSFDRNALIADLIVTVEHYLVQFVKTGFVAFKPAWEKVDYLNNQWITVSDPSGKLSGYAQGVNEQGLLCLKDEHETIHYVTAGEATTSSALNVRCNNCV
ncbi:MAG: biotin--[acetyl-CoA-carboxylase] ligase [Legionellales bacterium RIFCSPHIGHO2_12_FULL_42_9]|nr:MAG: biotin--[acetyl-CoA-carboxylase] ligase [Legionellales bacterium RIFCSPHIGHO2_12_FULL_42_9]